jgi:signal transduction histidine kinase
MERKNTLNSDSIEIPLLCELAGDSAHLIHARWVAGCLVLLATAICVHVLDLPLPEGPLYVLGTLILLYNAAIYFYTRRSYIPDPVLCIIHTRRILIIQISLDLISMAAFLHFTGGICSPAKPLLLIHVMVVAILMSRQIALLFVSLDVVMITLIAFFEFLGFLPHYSVTPAFPPNTYADEIYVLSRLAFIALASFAIGYLTTTIMNRQRTRDHRIGNLLRTAQKVSSTLNLSELTVDLAGCVAEALSVQGASVRLIDESSGRLLLFGAHGLSKTYCEHRAPEIPREILEEELLTNPPIIIHDVDQDPRLQDPKALLQEGIHSMAAAPILSRGKPLGILNVYARDVYAFKAPHIDFIIKIAALGATAIENALSYKRLELSGQERGMFVRMVTHELRTPVASAQSLVKTLLRGLAGDFAEKQYNLLTRVDVRLEQLMNLINDLLALAAGRIVDFEKQIHPVSIQQNVRQIVHQLDDEIESKRIKLTLREEETELYALATEDGMVKIFENLISNAIKYTPAGGKIGVAVESQGNLARIRISDNGIGIPTEDLPHIWDEFYRARNAKRTGIMGTGLGLSIVKHYVDAFGGLIDLTSVEGKGTNVLVTLPLSHEPPPSPEAEVVEGN